MTRTDQEQILGLQLNAKLKPYEVFLLEALSYGTPMGQIIQEGLHGRYLAESTLYDYRVSICSKIRMEFGRGSRKFIWLTGRYYKQIRALANKTEKEVEYA